MKEKLDKYKIGELIARWHAGKILPGEKEAVEDWFKDFNDDTTTVDNPQAGTPAELKSRIWHNIRKKALTPDRRHRAAFYRKAAAAAAILLLIALGFYMNYRYKTASLPSQVAKAGQSPIAPGGNKAILTLSDGKKVFLTDAKNGLIAQQGATVIRKTADGKVMYGPAGSHQTTSPYVNNTVSTPKGGEYQLTLSDGSRVWLNAASSITFPVAFNGKTREVSVEGEAYFEVVHDASRPFRVKAGGQIIEDIGTSFNVNAYPDETGPKTTLIEGAIKIGHFTLKPGEQAVINNGTLKLYKVDVEEVIAWKNGYFLFDNATLADIMRQIAHWYDVEISYQGTIPDIHFGGGIARSSTLQQVLSILEQSKVHFKIVHKKIIVMP